jgi:hypothetical protein
VIRYAVFEAEDFKRGKATLWAFERLMGSREFVSVQVGFTNGTANDLLTYFYRRVATAAGCLCRIRHQNSKLVVFSPLQAASPFAADSPSSLSSNVVLTLDTRGSRKA